jgi:outer membrane protein
MVLFVSFAILAQTTAAEEFLTLKETIEIALSENLQLKTSKEQTLNAIAMKNVSRSHLLPTFNIAYHYQRNDKAFISQGGIIEPENAYTFATTLKQPLFAGFSFKNRYAISQLQVDVAKNNEKLTRLDIVLSAQKIYFSLLKAQKMAAIAREAVIQIASHEKVANHFYQAGMVPLNDLLESQVELANTRQILINADNNLEIAKASFNTLLRRTINAPVMIEDITEFESFEHDFAFCLSAAKKNRQELKTNDLEIKATEYDLEISKKNYYPMVNLSWSYIQQGEDWAAKGGINSFSDSNSWNIKAMASWDLWDSGRTYFGTKEKLGRVSQARNRKEILEDQIRLEVKKAFLRTGEAEKNILVVKTAIQQAEENYRITTERYKEQVATSTDVLDAQFLLSRTTANYYNALYDFQISKATLYHAMGQVTPQ